MAIILEHRPSPRRHSGPNAIVATPYILSNTTPNILSNPTSKQRAPPNPVQIQYNPTKSTQHENALPYLMMRSKSFPYGPTKHAYAYTRRSLGF
jgi:hypothetical protein